MRHGTRGTGIPSRAGHPYSITHHDQFYMCQWTQTQVSGLWQKTKLLEGNLNKHCENKKPTEGPTNITKEED